MSRCPRPLPRKIVCHLIVSTSICSTPSIADTRNQHRKHASSPERMSAEQPHLPPRTQPQQSHTLSPSRQSLPITVSRSYKISGVRTDFLLQRFSGRTFLLITQVGKVGNLLSCTVEESEIDGSKTYNVSTLLGRRDDALLEVYARQITERIYGVEMGSVGAGGIGTCGIIPPLLLGMSLKRDCRDVDSFKRMTDLVEEIYLETVLPA